MIWINYAAHKCFKRKAHDTENSRLRNVKLFSYNFILFMTDSNIHLILIHEILPHFIPIINKSARICWSSIRGIRIAY